MDSHTAVFDSPRNSMRSSGQGSWHTESIHTVNSENLVEISSGNTLIESEQIHTPNSVRSSSTYSTDSDAASGSNNPSSANRVSDPAINEAPTGFRAKCKVALKRVLHRKSCEWSSNPAPTIPLIGRRFSLCSEVNIDISAATNSVVPAEVSIEDLSSPKRIETMWNRVKSRIVRKVKNTHCKKVCNRNNKRPLGRNKEDNSVRTLSSTASNWTTPELPTTAHTEAERSRSNHLEVVAARNLGRRGQQADFALMERAEDITARQEALFGRYMGFLERTGGARAAAREAAEME